MNRIVVGVDTSSGSEAALRWAVEEGRLHGAAVLAVLAWSYLDQHHDRAGAEFDPRYGDEDAAAALRATLESAGLAGAVEEAVVNDLPARALLEAAADADLLVVGARGLGGFAGLLLGSVSERLLECAPCPVGVVREDAPAEPGGPVAVGIDGSGTARTALRWAAAEAHARGVPLHVVHAWHVPVTADVINESLVAAVEAGAREVLQEALGDPAVDGLDVHGTLTCGGAARSLLEHADAEGAALVVTGTRGLGRLGRVLLGSTSRQLARHATCPTVVIPHPDDD